MTNRSVYVKCWLGSQVLASYEFLMPATKAAPPVIQPDTPIAEAKSNLTADRLAYPPYDDIETANAP
jgi:hypothetical protein